MVPSEVSNWAKKLASSLHRARLRQALPKIGAGFYDRDYFIGGAKSAYEDYSLCSGVMRTLGEMLLEAYGPLGRVLDVGCAYGYLVEYLRGRGVEAWGIDISQFAIAQAGREASPYLCVGNLLALPFADDSFDLVFSSESLEHVYENEAHRALSEIFRVSKGKVCLLIGLKGGMEDRDKGHVNLKSRRWWERLLAIFPNVHNNEVSSRFFNGHHHSQHMQWANRFFCLSVDKRSSVSALGRDGIPAEFFDREYFDGEGAISAYKGYTEEGLAGIFPPLAELLKATFRPKSALDCGCAKGYLVKSLRGLGIKAHGQDISAYAIDCAPSEVKPYLVAGSITELKFGRESFDLVISTDTLEHLTMSQIGSALREMKRVGKRYFLFTICLNLEPDCPDDLIITDLNDKSHITVANRNFWHKRLIGIGLTHRLDLEEQLANAELCRIMKWNVFVYEKRKLQYRIGDFIKRTRERLTWPRLKGRVRWLIALIRGGVK